MRIKKVATAKHEATLVSRTPLISLYVCQSLMNGVVVSIPSGIYLESHIYLDTTASRSSINISSIMAFSTW